jgi:F0F1-type ATP synthase membrane subunit b/b'
MQRAELRVELHWDKKGHSGCMILLADRYIRMCTSIKKFKKVIELADHNTDALEIFNKSVNEYITEIKGTASSILDKHQKTVDSIEASYKAETDYERAKHIEDSKEKLRKALKRNLKSLDTKYQRMKKFLKIIEEA